MYLGVAQTNQLKHCKQCKCLDCEYKPKGDDCVSVVKARSLRQARYSVVGTGW